MTYQNDLVENLLRNYYSLSAHDDMLFSDYKVDIEAGLRKLHDDSSSLYFTVISVFVNGTPIQEQAKKERVSTRQINRKLHDGLHMLTMIMNGDIL